jgi:hypothetical protein
VRKNSPGPCARAPTTGAVPHELTFLFSRRTLRACEQLIRVSASRKSRPSVQPLDSLNLQIHLIRRQPLHTAPPAAAFRFRWRRRSRRNGIRRAVGLCVRFRQRSLIIRRRVGNLQGVVGWCVHFWVLCGDIAGACVSPDPSRDQVSGQSDVFDGFSKTA